jgi:hypothetical protein
MSDMIWNGSYTLGNSQETQITAGTGIKVTTPAAGQIQISNDETVLWSGTKSFDITLSESIYNFKYIDVYPSGSGIRWLGAKRFDTKNISDSSNEFLLDAVFQFSTTSMYVFTSTWSVTTNGTKLESANKGMGYTIDSQKTITWYTNNNNAAICKVVGIQRK